MKVFKTGDRVRIVGELDDLRKRYRSYEGPGWVEEDMSEMVGKTGTVVAVVNDRVEISVDGMVSLPAWHWMEQDVELIVEEPEPEEPDCKCGDIAAAKLHGYIAGVVATADALFREGSYSQASRAYVAVASVINEYSYILNDEEISKE